MAMMVWIYSICTNASDNVKAGRWRSKAIPVTGHRVVRYRGFHIF
jgi:hypothetical protein